jgi:hypothetical protein
MKTGCPAANAPARSTVRRFAPSLLLIAACRRSLDSLESAYRARGYNSGCPKPQRPTFGSGFPRRQNVQVNGCSDEPGLNA